MKAIRVVTQPDGAFQIAPLPLPVQQRKGIADPENYRQQARGDAPIGRFSTQRSNFLRAIVLSDGKFDGLATQPGALLTFVISGDFTLAAGEQTCQLEPGDVFLTDAKSSSGVTLDVRNQGRLVQIDVTKDWPGPEAEIQEPGTIIPRENGAPPNFKRMYTGKDGKAFFGEFSQMFSSPPDLWTAPRPIQGFRMSCWSSGGIEYHPCVVNQVGLVMSGGLELQVSGDGATEVFYAGDICLAEDRTGEGHRNRKRGVSHTTYIVIADENLWPNK